MYSLSLHDLVTVGPQLILVLFAVLGLAVGVGRGQRLTVGLIQGGWILAAVLWVFYLLSGGSSDIAFMGQVATDQRSFFFQALTLAIVCVIFLCMYPSILKTEMERIEFPILTMVALVGAHLVLVANDLVSLFLALEVMSLSLYVLVGFRRSNAKTQEAALKYVLFGGLSSALLLYGFSILYTLTGAVHFDLIEDNLRRIAQAQAPLCALAVVCIFSAFAVKLALAPFHVWSPDVYEGSPTIVTSMVATLPKIIGVAMVLKFSHGPLSTLHNVVAPVLMALGVASIVLGTFSALNEKKFMRFLALSSVAQLGLIILGGIPGLETQGQSVLFYLFVYSFATLGVFIVVMLLRWDGLSCKTLEDLSGLWKTQPVLAAVLSFLMFMMAGLPPLAGFVAKFGLFQALVASNHTWIAVVAVVASIISCFYYLRVVKIMYFDDPKILDKEKILLYLANDKKTLGALFLCLAVLLTLSLYPKIVF